jgi:RIO-like serine/threonine protein kinase
MKNHEYTMAQLAISATEIKLKKAKRQLKKLPSNKTISKEEKKIISEIYEMQIKGYQKIIDNSNILKSI